MFINNRESNDASSFRSEMFAEARRLHCAPKGAVVHFWLTVSINIASLRDAALLHSL
jgi:hypothetical protein